jgi:hypothetical protein
VKSRILSLLRCVQIIYFYSSCFPVIPIYLFSYQVYITVIGVHVIGLKSSASNKLIATYQKCDKNYKMFCTSLVTIENNMFTVRHIIICYITYVALVTVTIVKNVKKLDNFLLICRQLFSHKKYVLC